MERPIIKVIEEDGIVEYQYSKLDSKQAGQKAIGLLSIPSAWRLPFFVISKSIIEKFKTIDKEVQKEFCQKIEGYIKKIAIEFGTEVTKLMIRSSGEEEGMIERGLYDSYECEKNKIGEKLLMILEKTCDKGEMIAYIVQPYIEQKILGHISNERRLSKDRRDWKIEHEGINNSQYSIAVRKWRTTYNLKEIVKEGLVCSGDTKSIKKQLRKIAYYYFESEKKERLHFEFIWNGQSIYLVQKDFEIEDVNAENPKEIDVKVNNIHGIENMKILRKIDYEDGEKYKKVKNVLMYKKMELSSALLYIIDDKETIGEMSKGVFRDDVRADFSMFEGKSIVIRTDVFNEGIEPVQLLPRSNELRDFESIKEWCQKELPKVIEYEYPALLIHIFIPAIASAFAYAEPNRRAVTIQSLWGLPEGLYYNAHDTFLIDTGFKSIQHIDENKLQISSTILDYKSVYIAPDSNGKWTEKKVKVPYDWGQSITDEQVKKIAVGSRKIAQQAGEAISIMWFVGIDSDYYGTECLPWFHESYMKNAFSHEIYKKKYYTEKEVIITSREDLAIHQQDENLKTITIHPQDDETLRDRSFIQDVGNFAKERGITIFLEGTILAHPVYALSATGVRIILAKKNKELIEKNNFNKLVRDKIPERIIHNMEDADCYKATGNLLIRYLKEKIVEEVFEVCDSSSEDIKEEIADVLEVVEALRNQMHKKEKFNNLSRKRIIPSNGENIKIAEYKDIKLLDKEQSGYLNYSHRQVLYSLERNHQFIELEVAITNKRKQEQERIQKNDNWKDDIVQLAYLILDERSQKGTLEKCHKLILMLNKIIQELNSTVDEINQMRKEKNEKNGGFSYGYVLGETKITTIKTDTYDSRFPLEDKEDSEEYEELSELLFTSATYIDYREHEEKELLVRIKYPLCLDLWQNEFSGKNVDALFGFNSHLQIKMERQNSDLCFSLYLRKNNYDQLTLFTK